MEPLGIIKAVNIVFYMASHLAQRHKAGGVQQFSLQAFEERLHFGVVGAVARPAHAVEHLVPGQHVPHLQGPEFDAAIRVQQKPRHRRAGGHGLPESPSGQFTVQAVSQLPAHDAAGEQIQNHGQEDVLPAHFDVGNVAAPLLINTSRLIQTEAVIRQRLEGGSSRDKATIDTVGPRLHTPLLHQAGNAVLADQHALPFKCPVYLGAAITAFAPVIDPPYPKQQFSILAGPLPWLASRPGVVAGA